MRYDFDERIERKHTSSLNVEGFRSCMFAERPDIRFPVPDDQMARMWVADMDFAVAPEIRQAIKDRVDQKIFGYTAIYGTEYYDALSAWCRKKYDWTFPQEELVISPGIVPALYELVGDLVRPGEKLLMATPAYSQFLHAAEYNGRACVYSPLVDRDGHFSIDFEDFERKAADPAVKLVLWCNPHNPTGRVWTEEEARRVAGIIERNDLWVISDEIHCDIIRHGQRHIPMGKIMPDYPKLITCMAASKTFNLAGMMFSNIIVRDRALRETMAAHDKLGGNVNPLALAANQAAYEHGYEWLEELRTYLDGNFAFAVDFIGKHIPGALCRVSEATYLAWVDMNGCLPDVEDLSLFLATQAGVLAEGGDRFFVGSAEGFVRLNLAMPRAMVQEGLERIAAAVARHRAERA